MRKVNNPTAIPAQNKTPITKTGNAMRTHTQPGMPLRGFRRLTA